MKNTKYSTVSNQQKYRAGVTLIELMITVLIAMLVLAGIGIAMVDSIKSFPAMNERTQGSVVTDAYVAKAAFDRYCRKASIKYSKPQIGNIADSLEVYHYQDGNSPALDRYATFSVSGKQLQVTYGQCTIVGPAASPVVTKTGAAYTEILATTIDSSIANPVMFMTDGADVIMVLRLKNGNQEMTVTSAAVRHNR
jgi:Tfp pilus assembly protein PilE